MVDARVKATADRVSALAEWRRLALINAAIGGIVGLAVVVVAIRLATRRPSLGDELREALDQHEFIVHYQPVMDLQENRCAGGEALIRWRHPQRGIVKPDVFIALAEETGAIVPMTRWLMQRVGEEVGDLLRADEDFHIAINLAPIHFVDFDVITDAKGAAEKSDIPTKQMLFEITERSLVDCAFCREVIEGLADVGSRVAIDDFGTGYSNLAYIGMFRLDFLKIDKAFVKTIGSGAASAGLAQVIVDMAHTLGLKIIAEGVETRDQAKLPARARRAARARMVFLEAAAGTGLRRVCTEACVRDGQRFFTAASALANSSLTRFSASLWDGPCAPRRDGRHTAVGPRSPRKPQEYGGMLLDRLGSTPNSRPGGP
jgi:sensor c-di-GMP phosphodiesterase-like protein